MRLGAVAMRAGGYCWKAAVVAAGRRRIGRHGDLLANEQTVCQMKNYELVQQRQVHLNNFFIGRCHPCLNEWLSEPMIQCMASVGAMIDFIVD